MAEPGPVPPEPADEAPSVVRVLALVAAVGFVVIGGAVGVGFWAWRTFAAPAAAATEAGPADREPRVDRDGSVLTRTERRQLEAELREVERELEFVRGQARAARSAGERAAWADEAAELAERRDRLRQRLGG